MEKLSTHPSRSELDGGVRFKNEKFIRDRKEYFYSIFASETSPNSFDNVGIVGDIWVEEGKGTWIRDADRWIPGGEESKHPKFKDRLFNGRKWVGETAERSKRFRQNKRKRMDEIYSSVETAEQEDHAGSSIQGSITNNPVKFILTCLYTRFRSRGTPKPIGRQKLLEENPNHRRH